MYLAKTPLTATLNKDGILTISIGVETLAYCSLKENGGALPKGYVIVDPVEWAKDVMDMFESENEHGVSILESMFDEAIILAFENGSINVEPMAHEE